MAAAKRLDARMDSIYEDLFEKDNELNRTLRTVIFAVLSVIKRVGDQSKNICDQTVFAVRGIAKLPKVYRVLFLDQPGSDLAQLAVAIGRHGFADSMEFTAAMPGASNPPSGALLEFLSTAGLPDEDLDTEQIEGLQHDFHHYEVIISLNGAYSDYIDKMPFHTSGLNWALDRDSDLTGHYRDLRNRITELVELIAGPDSTQD